MGNARSKSITDTDYEPEVSLEDWEIDVNPCPLKCLKHPDHKEFIPPADLDLHHLPPELRHETVLKWIFLEAKRAVKITVKATSPDRPETDRFHHYIGTGITRTASGRVWVQGPTDITMPCPVKQCPYSTILGPNHEVYGFLQVATNKHVICDDFEASNSVIDLFYDSRSHKRQGDVVKIYGTSVHHDIEGEDHTAMSCVFHEQDLPSAFELQEIFTTLAEIPPYIRQNMGRHCIIISHPHGMPKKVTFGDIKERLVPWSERSRLNGTLEKFFLRRKCVDDSKVWVTRYTTPTCPGSSGAAVLVCVDGRFCHPIYHSGHDTNLNLNLSKSYFK